MARLGGGGKTSSNRLSIGLAAQVGVEWMEGGAGAVGAGTDQWE